LLVEVLTGATLPARIPVFGPEVDVPPGIGHLFVLLDPAAFVPDFPARIDDYVESLVSLPPTPGSEPLRLPGDRAAELEEEALQHGVSLPDLDARSLVALAGRLGLVSELPAGLAELVP
jgi:LDH2 family malate/lactate/ureidoglycolate dehydrogenase